MCISVYFDASFLPEAKAGKIGFIIKRDNQNITKQSKSIKARNSNEAELKALDLTVTHLLDNIYKADEIKIYGDNKQVIEIINLGRKMKNTSKDFINSLIKKFNILKTLYNCSLEWISRKFNKDADKITRGKINQIKVVKDITYNLQQYNVPEKTERLYPIENIKIPKMIKYSTPNKTKVKNITDYYITNNAFDKPIKIDKNGTLKDGYIRYLIAKQFHLDLVPIYSV
jgi:ribonuclease HI